MQIVADGQAVSFEMEEGDGQELTNIILQVLPVWASLFESKNREYGDTSAMTLGPRGQFSDMYRKMIKLKRAMWDADESVLTTEGVEEILLDLVGHAFLTINMRQRGVK